MADSRSKTAPAPTKAALQREMEKTRESMVETVEGIRETVTEQYEAVKETVGGVMNFREQFPKRTACLESRRTLCRLCPGLYHWIRA